jgi:hypothetical protein
MAETDTLTQTLQAALLGRPANLGLTHLGGIQDLALH